MKADNDLVWAAKYELAKRHFWDFCRLMAPGFYQENRFYLKEMCQEMEGFYRSNDLALVINAPPRHGKSRTACLFAQWIFGQNQNEKIIAGAYNENLSAMFSKQVLSGLTEVKASSGYPVYQDVFPGTQVKKGQASAQLWSLAQGHHSFLATSPQGTATGFGASLLLIDDLIKNALEAANESILENHWRWFTDTLLSRLEENGKILLIMTRWDEKDLVGRVLDLFTLRKEKIRHLVYKAEQENGSMLCPEILSRESAAFKQQTLSPHIWWANYQQEPFSPKEQLYEDFSVYQTPPECFECILAYGDTADTGEDFFCMPIFGVSKGFGYILDVVYTDEPMEITEKLAAQALYRHNVDQAFFESNGGGRSFARNVERILWEEHQSRRTVIRWFHQRENKKARILTNASNVMNRLWFPEGWREQYRPYAKALFGYKRKGSNRSDDAADATTGCVELLCRRPSQFKGTLWVPGL